jgi:hypothetical protein
MMPKLLIRLTCVLTLSGQLPCHERCGFGDGIGTDLPADDRRGCLPPKVDQT